MERFRREDRPLVFAHRGASARRPENTCAAFELAEEEGADGIECDVRLCATGELVVCHDETLERLAGLSAMVRALPLQRLRALPILERRFPGSDARIPTLAEAIECAGPTMLWNIELKVDRHQEAEGLAVALVHELERLPLQGRVLVSSFHPHALLTLRTLEPALPTALLWEVGGRAGRLWSALWAQLCGSVAVHPPAAQVDAGRVERWRRRGYLINPWTVDDPDEIHRLQALRVDGVITNDPSRTLGLLQIGAAVPRVQR